MSSAESTGLISNTETSKKSGNCVKRHKVLTSILVVTFVLLVAAAVTIPLVLLPWLDEEESSESEDDDSRISVGKVPTDDDLSYLKKKGLIYDHVVVFGVDGAGGYFSEMDTPSFDKIFGEGSATYKALSQFPTNSAENWCSMLHGVRYQLHHVDNAKAASEDYTDTQYPSFLKVYGENHEGVQMASIVNWGPINKGIVEHNIPGVTTMDAKNYYVGPDNSSAIDDKVADLVIDFIQGNNSEIIFMQFDSVDHAGHSSGYGSDEFKTALAHIDTLIGRIYQAYCDKGWKDNTLFICVSDHGHEPSGGHGSDNPTVRFVTVAVYGSLGNVRKGKPGHVVTQDIASIVMYGLGEKQPDSWEARVPNRMFSSLKK